MQSKIKIFYIITKAFWGGAQRYAYDLVTHLPKEEFDIAVLVGGRGELIEKLNAQQIRIITLPLSNRFDPISDLKTFFKLCVILSKEKPQIIHLNSSKIGFLGGVAGRLTGIKKIIFTAHGWPFWEDRPWLVKKIFRLLSWVMILLHHHTICVSKAVYRGGSELPFAQEKLRVIHNGIESPLFFLRPAAKRFIQATFNLPYTTLDKPWIGSVAELTKNKGILYLIDAVSLLKEKVICIIIGEGKLKPAISRQISDRKLEEYIFLLGRVPEVDRLLKAFDIFVLPSITDAFPYTLLEAGLAELPMIASRVGGIPEIIENERTGLLVPTRDSNSLQRTLVMLLEDHEKALSLGANAKDFIEHTYTLERMMAKTVAIYKSVG